MRRDRFVLWLLAFAVFLVVLFIGVNMVNGMKIDRIDLFLLCAGLLIILALVIFGWFIG